MIKLTNILFEEPLKEDWRDFARALINGPFSSSNNEAWKQRVEKVEKAMVNFSMGLQTTDILSTGQSTPKEIVTWVKKQWWYDEENFNDVHSAIIVLRDYGRELYELINSTFPSMNRFDVSLFDSIGSLFYKRLFYRAFQANRTLERCEMTFRLITKERVNILQSIAPWSDNVFRSPNFNTVELLGSIKDLTDKLTKVRNELVEYEKFRQKLESEG